VSVKHSFIAKMTTSTKGHLRGIKK